ncbi:FAD binding domain-containing protein [Thozetella sp. PMI_491]|nr:FAD binding domain-containing protein [Thozetella sp. PMI_491]
MMQSVDVFIVGGGPTGAALALELSAQGISYRIVDKASGRSDKSRALAVQPRTLELLNRHGDVRNEFLSQLKVTTGMSMCLNGKTVVEATVSEDTLLTNTAFRTTALISQCETEKFLDQALSKHGVAVEWGIEVASIKQDETGVSVYLNAPGGSQESIRAKYVVGADGAHSVVRHATDISFNGDAYPQEFILADVFIDNKSETKLSQMLMCMGEGLVTILPYSRDGMVRVFASRVGNQQGEGDPTLDEFQQLLPRFVPGGDKMTLRDPFWLTRFRLHHRVANKYRDGRLFVAGDAAHIHSPAGGQGMNTGIQDAVNLGWKLAATIRGEQPDAFLDSYDKERRPVGDYLLRSSDRRFTFLSSTNPIFLFFRNLLMPWIMPLVFSPRGMKNYLQDISQFNIQYRDSELVGTAPGFSGSIKGGDRVLDGKIKGPAGETWLQELLTPESYHLVLFSGLESAGAEGDLHRAETKFLESFPTKVKVHALSGDSSQGYVDVDGVLHRQFGFAGGPGFVFIRPDSYVSYIGNLSSFEDFLNWVKK